MIVGHDRPLQVVGFIATRPGDAERGPLIRMNSGEAKARILTDGEIVRIYGPRRFELAPLVVDDRVPRGGAILRDIAGIAASELIKVIKLDLDSDRRPRNPVLAKG